MRFTVLYKKEKKEKQYCLSNCVQINHSETVPKSEQNFTSENYCRYRMLKRVRLRCPAKKVSTSVVIQAAEILIVKLSNLNSKEHLFNLGAVPPNQI